MHLIEETVENFQLVGVPLFHSERVILNRSQMAAINWAFTSFDEKKPEFNSDMRYLVYQQEKSPTTGRLHWQGYMQLKKKARMQSAKKTLGDEKAHMELAKGTPSQNKDYCTKEESRIGGPWEFGEMKGQGARTDLTTAGKLALEGKWEEIPDATLIRYAKGLEKLVTIRKKPQVREMSVEIIWGPTGTGKSHMANEKAPEAYWKPSGMWWDGYKGEKTVVIDEFDPEKHNVNDVLHWMDKWPVSVPIKGGFVPYECEKLIITSHFDPNLWYCGRTDEIKRRASITYCCVPACPRASTPPARRGDA